MISQPKLWKIINFVPKFTVWGSLVHSKWRYGVLMLCLIGCSRPPDHPGLRVGLITPGSIADAAWNSGAYAGLQRIRDSLGMVTRGR